MSWRSLVISKPARLSVKNKQLNIEQDYGDTSTIPLGDIAVLVLETEQATITTALLSSLAQHQVAVITCDDTHHPNGMLLSFLPHSRALKVMTKQLALTVPQKKRAWQNIVKRKLENQATCLDKFNSNRGEFVRTLSLKVRSGDPENKEATAARYYFTSLFGDNYTREQDIWVNSALNYGYAILRAAIARSLVAYGFLPAFGLHHRSQLNAFNLADDFIEPFRPIIDLWWVKSQKLISSSLTPTDKVQLLQLLYIDVDMPSGKMNVINAIDRVIQSFGRFCSDGECSKLELPKLL